MEIVVENFRWREGPLKTLPLVRMYGERPGERPGLSTKRRPDKTDWSLIYGKMLDQSTVSREIMLGWHPTCCGIAILMAHSFVPVN